jgi:hypothetical protein
VLFIPFVGSTLLGCEVLTHFSIINIVIFIGKWAAHSGKIHHVKKEKGWERPAGIYQAQSYSGKYKVGVY